MADSSQASPGQAAHDGSPSYRIGAVARLTGLSTHTLRKWEDRHALIAPRRSDGGERLYSSDDIQRLSLARDLARAGMPLNDLAALSTAELERLLQATRRAGEGEAAAQERERVRLAVLGPALASMMRRDAAQLRCARVVGSGVDAASLQTSLDGAAVDVLVAEFPAVSEDSAAELAAVMASINAGGALVVYGFGTHANVDAMRQPHVALARAPADAVEIERQCLGLAVSLWDRWPGSPDLPVMARSQPRRFSREALARVAAMSTDIACECPRHLADLILSLDAFEDYSAACESRNDKDAALHRHLHETAAAGRQLLEDALSRVAAHESLDMDNLASR